MAEGEEEKAEAHNVAPHSAVLDDEHKQKDFSQDVEAKGDEVCFQPGPSTAVKSDVSILNDVHGAEAKKSELTLPCDAHGREAIRPCTSDLPDGQNRQGKETSFLVDSGADPPKLDLVGPDGVVGEDSGGLVVSRISGDVSKKPISAPYGIDIPLENIKSADIKETKLHGIKAADVEDTQLPSLLNKQDLSHAYPKPDIAEDANHDLQSRKDMDLKSLRPCSSQVKRRSLSPAVSYGDGNKRPAIICEYFAKGWCIKGSSCRFLHKREHVDSARQKAEDDTLSTKSKLRANEGSGDKADSSKLPLHDQLDVVAESGDELLPRSTGKNILQDGDNLKRNPYNEADKSSPLLRGVSSSFLSAESQKSPSCIDASRSFSGQRGIDADFFRDSLLSNDQSVAGGGFQPHGSSFSGYEPLSREAGVAFGSNSNSRFHTYSLLQESAAMRRRYFSDGHSLPGFASPMDIDPNSSVPVSGGMSSYKTSGWKNNSSSYTSSKEDAFGAHYSLGCNREDSAFASHSTDPHPSPKYKTRFTPYKWEPSVPFRPSFFIPSLGTSSSDIPYDPIRDSLEQPDLGPVSSRHSYKHGSSIPDLRRIPERNSAESQKDLHSDTWDKNYDDNSRDLRRISERNSAESQKKLHGDTWDKNYDDNSKDVHVVEAESAATSASDVQNRNIPEDEDPVVPASVKDVLKASRIIADANSSLQSDGSRSREVGVEKCREPNALDEEEAKAIKYFRAALIDYVKELMKPIWHEGRLSKDVYKVIVQKAEDKILSSLQPNQVPNTSESIKQYLSASCPKILKLIQAYVDKYGKF